jgi:hypothetical protein
MDLKSILIDSSLKSSYIAGPIFILTVTLSSLKVAIFISVITYLIVFAISAIKLNKRINQLGQYTTYLQFDYSIRQIKNIRIILYLATATTIFSAIIIFRIVFKISKIAQLVPLWFKVLIAALPVLLLIFLFVKIRVRITDKGIITGAFGATCTIIFWEELNSYQVKEGLLILDTKAQAIPPVIPLFNQEQNVTQLLNYYAQGKIKN